MKVDNIEVTATVNAESAQVHTQQEEAASENSEWDGVVSKEAEEAEEQVLPPDLQEVMSRYPWRKFFIKWIF